MEEVKTKKAKNEENKLCEDIKLLNLFEKMSRIANEIGVVNKNLEVSIGKTLSYKAVSEADVLSAVKSLEAKYRVFSFPCSRRIVDQEILQTEKSYNGQTTKSTQQFLRIETTYRFVNIDNTNEFIDVISYGDGIDPQDKACGKGMTYSDKYALMKAYKMITGDDPDQYGSEEQNWGDNKVTSNNKIIPKEQSDDLISKEQSDGLNSSISNHKISNDVVEKILKKYNYKTIGEIEAKNYANILNEFKAIL